MSKLNSNVPTGDLDKRWDKHLFELSLIAPQIELSTMLLLLVLDLPALLYVPL